VSKISNANHGKILDEVPPNRFPASYVSVVEVR